VTHVALGLQGFRILEDDQERHKEEHPMRSLHVAVFSLLSCAEKRSNIFAYAFSILSFLSRSPHYVIHKYTHKRTGMRMKMMMMMMKMICF